MARREPEARRSTRLGTGSRRSLPAGSQLAAQSTPHSHCRSNGAVRVPAPIRRRRDRLHPFDDDTSWRICRALFLGPLSALCLSSWPLLT